jgi:hypothetical protein
VQLAHEVRRTAALDADPRPDRFGRGEDTVLVSRTGACEEKVRGFVGWTSRRFSKSSRW